MTAKGRLSALLLMLGISMSLQADVLSGSETSNSVINADSQQLFLETTLTFDSTGEPVGWMLAPTPLGVSYCGSEESVNCLTSADLVSKLTIHSENGDDDNGPVRNNLPEPATLELLAGGAPLIVRRLKRAVANL